MIGSVRESKVAIVSVEKSVKDKAFRGLAGKDGAEQRHKHQSNKPHKACVQLRNQLLKSCDRPGEGLTRTAVCVTRVRGLNDVTEDAEDREPCVPALRVKC